MQNERSCSIYRPTTALPALLGVKHCGEQEKFGRRLAGKNKTPKRQHAIERKNEI